MLQQDECDDFVLATGEMHTVREFLEKAFAYVDIQLGWRGEAVEEEGFDVANPERVVVRIDPKYFRPTEVDQLLGNPAKAKEKLGWTPTCTFQELVECMVAGDLELAAKNDVNN